MKLRIKWFIQAQKWVQFKEKNFLLYFTRTSPPKWGNAMRGKGKKKKKKIDEI
jgi:hypothetical protein